MSGVAAGGRPDKDGTDDLGKPDDWKSFNQWARGELVRVAAMLGDEWTVWYVATPYDPVSAFTWCAKPCGARVATCSGSVPGELAEAVREYVADLTLHLADARAELEGIPPSRPAHYQVVRDLIDALQALQAPAA